MQRSLMNSHHAKENTLAQDPATNKWHRKKNTLHNEKQSLQNSPVCDGVDISDIEMLRHDPATEDVYIPHDFRKILQNLSSIKYALELENSNEMDSKINASMDIKSPNSVASCSATPTVASAKRKYYFPLNVSVVKTPQLPVETPNIPLESPVKRDSKHKRHRRPRDEMEPTYSEEDETLSTVERPKKSGRKSRTSTESVSFLEESLYAKSEKSWIAEKKKKPREKERLQTYNCKPKQKPSWSQDSQEEDKDEETDDVMLDQISPVYIQGLSFSQGIGNIFDEQLSISAIQTPVSRQGSRKSGSRHGSRKSGSRQGSRKSGSRQDSRKSGSQFDLDSLLSMPVQGTTFDLNSLYSKCDADDAQTALPSFDVENFVDEPQKEHHNAYVKTMMDADGFVSGPSSEVRPTRSSLKGNILHVTTSDEEDSSNSSSGNDAEENSILMPKKLFKFDLTGYAPAPAPSIFSDATSLPDEDCHTQFGLSSFCAAFRADIQKNLQLKRKRLEYFTKHTLKDAHKHFNQTWVEQNQNRVNVFDEFQQKMLIELMALEKDIQKLADAEKKCEEIFKYQLDAIHANKESQQKRIQNMKKLQAHLQERTRAVTKYNLNVNNALKEKLKEDIAALQKKLVAETQKEEMMNIKRGLQSLF